MKRHARKSEMTLATLISRINAVLGVDDIGSQVCEAGGLLKSVGVGPYYMRDLWEDEVYEKNITVAGLVAMGVDHSAITHAEAGELFTNLATGATSSR
jgi:hypothetical protein